VATGSVHFQIAGDLKTSGVDEWVTLRPAAAHGSATAVDLTGEWEDSRGHNWPSLAALLSDVVSLNLYGVGVSLDPSVGAVVASITFDGTTYDFAPPVTSQAPSKPGKIDTAAK